MDKNNKFENRIEYKIICVRVILSSRPNIIFHAYICLLIFDRILFLAGMLNKKNAAADYTADRN